MRSMPMFRWSCWTLLVLGAQPGCGGGGGITDSGVALQVPTRIVITPALPTVAMGSTIPMAGSPQTAAGAVVNVAVTWGSNNPAVATVVATGIVTGVSAGATYITASLTFGASSIKDSVPISVTAAPVASVTVSPPNVLLTTGQATLLTATPKDAANNPVGATVRWSSQSPAVAGVDSITGLVTAASVGTTQVRATVVGTVIFGSSTVSVAASAMVVPALPAVSVNSAVPSPTPGARTIVVAAGSNLQTVIDTAKPGDVIRLQSGATFSFAAGLNLRRKPGGSAPIIIRSDVPDAAMPVEGARMKPAFAPLLAKIQTSNGVSAILTDRKASNYRFMFVEITASTDSALSLNAIIRAGDPTNPFIDSVSQNIIFDRVYVHGRPNLPIARCFMVSTGAMAIVDSYISECHVKGGDAQGIVGWNGPGPWKFENNYIEGSGMGIMIGGADPALTNVTPSDIVIRRNHMFKPLAWRGVWSVKNGMEIKMGRRVLIEGNVIENVWPDAQVGFALNLKTANENGAAPWVCTCDVTVRYNRIRNAAGGVSMLSTAEGSGGFRADSTMRRLSVNNNIFEDIGVITPPVGVDRFISMGSPPAIPNTAMKDIVLDHNDFVTSSSLTGGAWSIDGSAPLATNVWFTNNIIVRGGSLLLKGSGQFEGNSSVTFFMNGTLTFSKNALIGLPDSTRYAGSGTPFSGNFFPANLAAMGFVNFAGKNYRLTAGSLFTLPANLGLDAKPVGADIDIVELTTAGVVSP